jgi:hypothetical protein
MCLKDLRKEVVLHDCQLWPFFTFVDCGPTLFSEKNYDFDIDIKIRFYTAKVEF